MIYGVSRNDEKSSCFPVLLPAICNSGNDSSSHAVSATVAKMVMLKWCNFSCVLVRFYAFLIIFERSRKRKKSLTSG